MIGAKHTPSLNPESSHSGSFDLEYITDYGINYSYKKGEYYSGRIGGFIAVLEDLFGKSNFWLKGVTKYKKYIGYGPVELILKKGANDTAFMNIRNLKAPTKLLFTGLTYYILQIGIIGASCVLVLYFCVFRYLYYLTKSTKDSYMKFICFSVFVMFFIIITDFVTYSNSSVNHYSVSIISFYFAGYLRKEFDKGKGLIKSQQSLLRDRRVKLSSSYRF